MTSFPELILSEHWGIEPLKLETASTNSFNTIHRVTTAGGEFALRVGANHRIHTRGVENVEAAWLVALAEAGVDVVSPVATVDDRWSVDRDVGSADNPLTCSLFGWLPGRPLRDSTSPQLIRRAGEMLGRLHEHAASFDVTAPESIHATRVVYFAEANHIADHGAVYAEAIARIQVLIDDLWRAPRGRPHLLHGDFGAHNLLVDGDRVTAIDFQDLQWGFAHQDVAIAVNVLRRSSPELAGEFEAGYRSVHEWPELTTDELDAFAAARSLNIMNLGLAAPGTRIASAAADQAARVEEWMRAG